jgi:putative ABC transport system substrate-binding protein
MSGKNIFFKMSQNKLLAFTGIISIGLLLSGCTASPKIYRVGILSGVDLFAQTTDGFKAKMTELGYIEGKNIIYDLYKSNFEPDKEHQILKKYVSDKVDLIFVFPTEVTIAAKAATQGTKIPILFANVMIEGVDLVNSVREPGGNITGVRFPGPDLAMKSFEIMHELVPKAKRYYLFYQKGNPIVEPQLEALRPVVQSAGIMLIEFPVSTPAELEADLKSHVKWNDPGMDAIFMIPDPLSASPQFINIIEKSATNYKIPYTCGLNVGENAIYSMSTINVSVGRQAAVLANKILMGTPAGTIPVVSAEYWLQINYRAAQKLGLSVSERLLSLADEIIR